MQNATPTGGANDIATLQYLQQHPGCTPEEISNSTGQAIVHVERFLIDIVKHDVGYVDADNRYTLGKPMQDNVQRFNTEQAEWKEGILSALETVDTPQTLKSIANALDTKRRVIRFSMQQLVREGKVTRLQTKPRTYTLS